MGNDLREHESYFWWLRLLVDTWSFSKVFDSQLPWSIVELILRYPFMIFSYVVHITETLASYFHVLRVSIGI